MKQRKSKIEQGFIYIYKHYKRKNVLKSRNTDCLTINLFSCAVDHLYFGNLIQGKNIIP